MKFEVNLIYFKTLEALRPRTSFRSSYYTKNRTLTALSNFRQFLKNKNSLEPYNMIFRIRSPKGIFGQNMSNLPNGSLTGFLDPNSQPFLRIHSLVHHVIQFIYQVICFSSKASYSWIIYTLDNACFFFVFFFNLKFPPINQFNCSCFFHDLEENITLLCHHAPSRAITCH